MNSKRAYRAKLNIVFSLFGQFVTLICGIIVPRLLISNFGSEAYGATTSIAQFLAYIALFEGGIGGVARASLYKPLADNDYSKVSSILNEIQRFFRVIGYIFIVYVFVLACCFKKISHFETYDWLSSFLLVVVISISTFAQYFIGISYSVLLQAAQRTYIVNLMNIVTMLINTLSVLVLVYLGCNLIVVKLASSIIFVLRPIALLIYVRRVFPLQKVYQKNTSYLKQKWNGLGQHLAFFLHSNTDVALLTLFGNLKLVAVYSVYNMITTAVQNVAASFTTGMESIFGDMIANEERDNLNKTFGYYETLISIISTILFSVTIVLIVPFVRLYTRGINDTNYLVPLFSLLLVASCILFCLRSPYHSIIIAAGHFKETQMAAYGEAIINIVLSILLVQKLGLIGVATGTLIAVIYRFLYYVLYLNKHILFRPIPLFVKRFSINGLLLLMSICTSHSISNYFNINNYSSWFLVAVISTIISTCIIIVGNTLFYKNEIKGILRHSNK